MKWPAIGGLRRWPDGARYEGSFWFGKRNGGGVMTLPDGRRREGVFDEGLFKGRGIAAERSRMLTRERQWPQWWR